MHLVVFRSRLQESNRPEYSALAEEIDALAHQQPGFIAAKTFTASDGERVTIAEFESEEAILAWKNEPNHSEAQRMGRERFYSEYRVQVGKVLRDYRFVREPDPLDESAGE